MKNMIKLAAVAAVLACSPAAADTYQFDLTGTYTASFQIASSPVPSQTFPGTFVVANVSGVYQGAASARDVFFYDAATGGAFGLKNTNNSRFTLVTDGAQLFTGGIDAPTFKTGTFALTQFSGTGHYGLTITNLDAVVPTVPEPATWAMMIGGFGFVGAAKRRRRTSVRYA